MYIYIQDASRFQFFDISNLNKESIYEISVK